MSLKHTTETVTIILGRDSMGEASEEDFQAFVEYVETHKPAFGCDVIIGKRAKRDVQSDDILGTDDRQAILDILGALWIAFCKAE